MSNVVSNLFSIFETRAIHKMVDNFEGRTPGLSQVEHDDNVMITDPDKGQNENQAPTTEAQEKEQKEQLRQMKREEYKFYKVKMLATIGITIVTSRKSKKSARPTSRTST